LFNGNAGLALIFTYWDVADGRQCQGLAYSRDGYEFETYSGNPVIPQLRCLPGGDDDPDFRDPKVFWHEASARWVMIVAGGIVRLFSSDNLIDWRLENSYPDLRTECPDLFPLILEGRERWVLSGGGQWYLVGNFDGKSFEHTARRQGFTHGRDFYASQTWSDVPDGRRLMTTWLYSWGYKGVQTAPWSGGCLTLPYELSLGGPHEEPRLVMRPAAEVEGLRHERAPLADKLARGSLDIQLGSGAFEVEATVHDNGSAIFAVPGPVGVYRFGYVGDTREMFIDRTKAGHAGIEGFAERFAARVAARDGVVRLRVFVDGCSIELFGNNGEVVITCLALIDTRGPRVKVEGNAVAELAVYGLRSIWR
jgi:sucrose-6-phosphate hydrolase SacC (GH32 family)